jgi:hypothetical protein
MQESQIGSCVKCFGIVGQRDNLGLLIDKELERVLLIDEGQRSE